jgi:hypothetical protein
MSLLITVHQLCCPLLKTPWNGGEMQHMIGTALARGTAVGCILALASALLLAGCDAGRPTDGRITTFAPPVGSPILGIAATPDGNLWFTTRFRVGRVTPEGDVTLLPLPGLDAASSTIQLDLSPGVIHPVAGRDGAVWFPKPLWSQAEIGHQTFVRVTPGGVISEYDLPANRSVA